MENTFQHTILEFSKFTKACITSGFTAEEKQKLKPMLVELTSYVDVQSLRSAISSNIKVKVISPFDLSELLAFIQRSINYWQTQKFFNDRSIFGLFLYKLLPFCCEGAQEHEKNYNVIKKAHDTLLLILQLADVECLIMFYKDLVVLLHDLCMVLEYHAQNNNSNNDNQITITCFTSFCKDTEEGNYSLELDISTPSRLFSLLSCMDVCVEAAMQKYPQFLGAHSSTLWNLLIHQVKLGPDSVRQRSLITIHTIMRILDIPHIVFDNLVNLFISVLIQQSSGPRNIQVDHQLGYCLLEMVKRCPNDYLWPISNSLISRIFAFTRSNTTAITKSSALMKALCELFRIVVIENCADPRKEIKLINHLVCSPQLRSEIVQSYVLAVQRTINTDKSHEQNDRLSSRKRKKDGEEDPSGIPNKKLKLRNYKTASAQRTSGSYNGIIMDLYALLHDEYNSQDMNGLNPQTLRFLNTLCVAFEVSIYFPDYCPINQLVSKLGDIVKVVLENKEQTLLYIHHILALVDVIRFIRCKGQQSLLRALISLINKALIAVSEPNFHLTSTRDNSDNMNVDDGGNADWSNNVEELTCRCIEVLACIQTDEDTTFEEVKKMFLSCLLDNRLAVKRTVIRMIPLLCSTAQSPHILNDLLMKLYTIIQTLSAAKDPCVADVAEHLGPLACAATKHICSITIWQESADQPSKIVDSSILELCEPIVRSTVLQYSLTCSMCNTEERENIDTRTKGVKVKSEEYKTLEWNMAWRGMCKLFIESKSISGEARSLFLQTLPNIVNHMKMYDLKTDQDIFLKIKTFLTDDTYAVRKNVGVALRSMISNSGSTWIWDSESSLQSLFEQDLSKASLQTQPDILETYLMTHGQVGSKVQGVYLMCVVIALIEKLIHKNAKVRAVAYDQLVLVSEKQRGIPALLAEYKDQFYPWLIQKLKDGADELVNEVATSIFDLNLHQFLLHSLPLVLPYLVDNKNKDLIECLSHRLRMSPKEFITDYLPEVFFHLFLKNNNEGDVALRERLDFLEEIIGSDWRVMVKAAQVDLMKRLVIRLGETEDDDAEYDKVKSALEIIAKVKMESSSVSQKSVPLITRLITSQFLEIMDFLSNSLIKKQGLEQKRKILNSLRCLIRFLSKKKLNSFRPKIMVTLKNALHFPDLVKEACSVWYIFIKSLDVQDLGPIMSQVIADLGEYIQTATDEVVKIFEYLIVENKSTLQPHFSEVISIPDIPQLKTVAATLAADRSTEESSWQSSIKSLLQFGLCHENLAVRSTALVQLRQIINKYRHEIYNHVLSSDTSNDLVARLIRVLLKDLSIVESREVLIKYTECLGDLGAIDPSRIDIVLKSNLPKELDEEEMTKTLVEKYLITALHALHAEVPTDTPSDARSERYDSRTDRIGCAIQNILQLMPADFLSKIKGKELIEPFLTSKYQANPASATSKDVIYENGMPYKDWLGKWMNSMISTSSGSDSIFHACRQVVKDDTNTALFLLPYLVLQVLKKGGGGAIHNEVLAVLNEGQQDIMEEDEGSLESNLAYLKEYDDENAQMCNQTVFLLVDLLNTWKEESNKGKSKSRKSSQQNSSILEIPDLVMARASYRCRAYARALLYFEEHLRKYTSSASDREVAEITAANFPFLQKIYAGIEDEPDGMKGIVLLRTPALARKLSEQISDAERDGQWLEAEMLYEQAIQSEPNNMDLQVGRLKCMKNLGQFETVISTCSESGLNSHMINSFAIQSAWRLEKWDLLGRLIKQDDDVRDDDPQVDGGAEKGNKKQRQKDEYMFEIALGKILYSMKTGDDKGFESELENTRIRIIGPLAAAAMESYERCYPSLLKLHTLSELEQSWSVFKQSSSPGMFEDKKLMLMTQWDSRMRIVQGALKEREMMLNLGRVSISDSVVSSNNNKFPSDASAMAKKKCWLQIAKEARREKQFSTATAAILQLSTIPTSEVIIERAKLLWEQEQFHKAIQTLEKTKELLHTSGGASASSVSASDSSLTTKSPKEGEIKVGQSGLVDARTKMTLLLARWLGQTGHNDKTQLSLYRDITKTAPYWDKYLFEVGKHYDKAYVNTINATDYSEEFESEGFRSAQKWLKYAVSHYGRCVEVGNHFLYQSLPRLLSLWLDNGEVLGQIMSCKLKSGDERKAAQSAQKDLHSQVTRLVTKIKPYQWYTCFTQLTSRLCHSNEGVWEILKDIIVSVLKTYLRQAIWPCIALTSSSGNREARMSEILKLAQNENPSEEKFIQAMKTLCTTLDELAKIKPKDKKNLKKFHVSMPKSLVEFAKTCNKVIIPTQKQLTVTLPLDERSSVSSLVPRVDGSFKPFEDVVTIVSFGSEVSVMSSLQVPKKITIKGSDGKQYIFLAKDGDDLRKDTRLLEICSLVNKLLRESPEARRRRLHILTYAVTSIHDKCGLIEWVPDTMPLRHILDRLYSKNTDPPPLSFDDIKKIWEGKHKKNEDKLKTVRHNYPPVLYKWFISSFPEPRSWFDARLIFTQSLAVMSMVGYILGLGDRHGENILINTHTGKILHVDFGCLFWKGRTFAVPEKVPFRLTENIVNAMGVTGYEGVFRSVCEITLYVLRNNRDTLMSVIETFLHDPLVEWSDKEKNKKNKEGKGEKMDGKKSVGKIEKILQGKEHPGLPLSVEAQVDEQIQESVSRENLNGMYIGWASWL